MHIDMPSGFSCIFSVSWLVLMREAVLEAYDSVGMQVPGTSARWISCWPVASLAHSLSGGCLMCQWGVESHTIGDLIR